MSASRPSRHRVAADLNRRKDFGYKVGEVARLWRGQIDRHLKPVGISFMQWSTLTQLSRAEGGLMQKELAQRVSIETPTMVGVLDRLVKGGLAKREVSSTDRRVNTVHLTDKGRDILQAAEVELNKLRVLLLSDFTDDELEAGMVMLSRIADRAREI